MKPLHEHDDAELLARLMQARAELPPVPDAWRERALAAFAAHAAVAPGAPAQVLGAAAALVQGVLATLRFDSWAQPALAAGLRAVRPATRHLLFSADGRDLDLRITPEGDGFVLTGQVLGPDERGLIALSSLDGQGGACQGELDEFGEFRLANVAAGRYRLQLLTAGARVLVDPLEVGAAQT